MKMVTIVASDELSELRLMDLVGRQGLIKETSYNHDGTVVRGVWVELFGDPYLNEKEWYIPIKSIQNDNP